MAEFGGEGVIINTKRQEFQRAKDANRELLRDYEAVKALNALRIARRIPENGQPADNTAFVFQITEAADPRVIVGLATEVEERIPESFRGREDVVPLKEIKFRGVGIQAKDGVLSGVVSTGTGWEQIDPVAKKITGFVTDPAALEKMLQLAEPGERYDYDPKAHQGFSRSVTGSDETLQRLF